MNWLKKTRLELAKLRPVLTDIRALYHDGIGVPIKVLRLIENDPLYLAKPNNYANIIRYFQDAKLLKHICRICPIKYSIHRIRNSPKQESSIISIYNKDITKLKEIKKIVKIKKRANYILQNARYRHSIGINRYNTIEDISMMTSITVKKLYKMEKSGFLINDLDEANIILTTYHDSILCEQICGICPAKIAANEMKKDINQKEEI